MTSDEKGKDKASSKKPSKAERTTKINPSDRRETHRSRSFGHTSSGSRRHKPKRAKAPRKFNEWPPEDQETYHELTVQLRRWKAMQRQCSYIRRHVNQWTNLKSPEYQAELAQYTKTKAEVVPVPKEASFDLPPFEQ